MYRVAVIGCGGRGKAHARGYKACPKTELVACADPDDGARAAFAAAFEVPGSYADYREMLERERPDLVSICTWTPLHKEMALAAVAAGVKAIHCEKPIAPTWGDSQELVSACQQAGVVITFCHQRRFEAPFVAARRLVQEGAIGRLVRIEGYCPNMFDWGTHWFDMFFFYNDQTPALWVMGQVDYSAPRSVFGVPVDTQGISYIQYANDVVGLMITGEGCGRSLQNLIVGTEGIIRVNAGAPRLEVLRFGSDWEQPSLEGVVAHRDPTAATVFDLVDALETGREPELSGRKALQATELIFATYESSRSRGRVILPLQSKDSALLTMIERGELGAVS